MMPLFAVSLLISAVTGFLGVRLLLAAPDKGNETLPLQLFLGAGGGIGLSSCVYFVCLLAGADHWTPLIDILLCLGLAVACFFQRRGVRTSRSPAVEITVKSSRVANSVSDAPRTILEKLLLSAFFIELAAFCGAFLLAFLKEPHGRWDAWLIWNMHARFLARAGEAWRTVFSLPMDWSHWDYPLLLPLTIVRSWKYSGAESVHVPAALAFLFTLLTAGLLLFAVNRLKNLTGGLVAAMVLLATPFFILMGISQFADVPFSFFILAAIVLLCLPESNEERHFGPLVLAGVFAGLAAWTKNEGILFFLVAGLVLFSGTAARRGGREAAVKIGWFLAGSLPVLLCVICFKLQLAPPNDLTTGLAAGETALSKLTDPGRYAVIIKNFLITGINFTNGPVDLRAGGKLHPGAVNILLPVAWLWFMGIDRDPKTLYGAIYAAAVLAVMVAGYFAVYLLTPLPLEYHLATSLNRLYLQLWPSVIFLFFMIARAPGDKHPDPGKNPAGKSVPPSHKKERKRQ